MNALEWKQFKILFWNQCLKVRLDLAIFVRAVFLDWMMHSKNYLLLLEKKKHHSLS